MPLSKGDARILKASLGNLPAAINTLRDDPDLSSEDGAIETKEDDLPELESKEN